MRQIPAVAMSEIMPSPIHARAELSPRCISSRQNPPATAIPVPTPAHTTPFNAGRPAAASFSRHHAKAKTCAQAFAIPANARSTIQTANRCSSPIPSVATPIATRLHRIAVAGRTRKHIAEAEPSKKPK